MDVGISKCKRARRMVLDAYSGYFTTEYSKLEAYVDELLRSNPGPTVGIMAHSLLKWWLTHY